MTDKPLEKVMEDAHLHAAALRNERMSRTGGKHADDQRIATEIAAHQFQLGKLEKALTDQNERWRVGTAKNIETIKEIRAIYSRLQDEMDIATHRNLVV